jgi:8-oxo-dGTP diphosphatase
MMTGTKDTAVIAEMRIVKAVIVDPAGRYLMQLRDDIPTIPFPDHWCLFGGTVDPGETDDGAMRRELAEELTFAPEQLRPITTFTYAVVQYGILRRQVAVFEALIDDARIAQLELHEGAAMRFMTPDALLREARVVPWDLCAVLMHHRVLPHPELLSPALRRE